MSELTLALRWYLVVQFFGLAALPLGLRLFHWLPDRGYGVSKALGLLVAGYAFWLLATFGWVHNTVGGILVALTLLVAAGAILWLGFRHPTSQPINQLPWRTMLATEAVFAAAFAAWCLVRAHMPRIETTGGEKWMEIAFLNAILRSETFPPHDPWLSGFAISYYYFGYLIVAMVTRLAAVPSSIAFNLGIATLFALTCAGAFSLVYNLIAAGRERARALWGGLLGPLLVAVMGNLEGLLEVLHARGLGPASFWRWLDIRSINIAPPPFTEGGWLPTRFIWWWQASRVLHDYTPWGAEQEVIDEFPAFSFILGDMHPHVLALPFVLLALALALNLYRRASLKPETWNLKLLHRTIPFPLKPWELLIYALCLGGLGFLNTWDFPIYLFVVVAAYALTYLRTTHHASRFTFDVLRFASLFIALLVLGLLVYLPFWLGFQSQAAGIVPNLFNSTRLPQFLVMFGPFAFIGTVFIISQAQRRGVRVLEVVLWTAAAVMAAVVLLLVAGLASPDARHYLAAWLRGASIPGLEHVPDARTQVSHALLLRLLTPWTALALAATIVTVILTLTRNPHHVSRFTFHISRTTHPAIRNSQFAICNFALLLLATGCLLTLAVELVYLRDHFGTRMNTVFKFYFQAWVMWGVAGAYGLSELIREGRWCTVAMAVLLIVAGLIYPALAIPTRAREYGDAPTLDGAAYLAQMYPDDYAAITWLNENVSGAPVILEAPGDHVRGYVYEGRVSAHTGLPTLLGWGNHENQWRGSYEEPARREPDIETLYTSGEVDEVLTLLDKYGISYVYIGPVERARYPAAGLAKFAQLMETVYDTGTVTIYRR